MLRINILLTCYFNEAASTPHRWNECLCHKKWVWSPCDPEL